MLNFWTKICRFTHCALVKQEWENAWQPMPHRRGYLQSASNSFGFKGESHLILVEVIKAEWVDQSCKHDFNGTIHRINFAFSHIRHRAWRLTCERRSAKIASLPAAQLPISIAQAKKRDFQCPLCNSGKTGKNQENLQFLQVVFLPISPTQKLQKHMKVKSVSW